MGSQQSQAGPHVLLREDVQGARWRKAGGRMVRLPWANTPDATRKSVCSVLHRKIDKLGEPLREMVGEQKLNRWDRTSPTKEGLVKGHSRLGVLAQRKGPETGRTKGSQCELKWKKGLGNKYAWCGLKGSPSGLAWGSYGWALAFISDCNGKPLQGFQAGELHDLIQLWERTDCVTSLLSGRKTSGVIMDAKAKYASFLSKAASPRVDSWEWEPIKTRYSFFFFNTQSCMYLVLVPTYGILGCRYGI